MLEKMGREMIKVTGKKKNRKRKVRKKVKRSVFLTERSKQKVARWPKPVK